MSNNISSDNTSVQNISSLTSSSSPLNGKDSSNVSVMFYVMKSMQDTIKGDMQCLQKQTKEEMEKQAIEKVLLTIKGLSNKQAFLKGLGVTIGSSDPTLKSFVDGLLQGIEQIQAEEKKIKNQEKQAQAKMAADNDLTKHPAYEDKYVLTPDLKEEVQDFAKPSVKSVFKGLWNFVDGKIEGNLMRLALCKMSEAILKNPTAKKDIGSIVNSNTFKGLIGDNDNKNSKSGVIAEFLASATNHPVLADVLTYSDKINKELDKAEKWLAKKTENLSQKLEKETSKGQFSASSLYTVPRDFIGVVADDLAGMLLGTDTKAFHIVSGEGNYTIDPDKTSLQTWQKDTSTFEMNAKNISDLIISAEDNKISENMQQNSNTLKELAQDTQSLNSYGKMLESLISNNKV